MNDPKDWTFRDVDLARQFDTYVRGQLPWYDLVTRAVVHIARHFIEDRGLIYDIGASTGNIEMALRPLIDDRNAVFVPIDNVPEMAENYKGSERLLVMDATNYQYERFDLAICFLSLMFMSVGRRAQLIHKLRQMMKKSGAIIIVDKFMPKEGYHSIIMARLNLWMKLDAGATPEEIIEKELSLSGIQRPLFSDDLEGFSKWFQFGDFAGYLICE